MEGSGYGLIQTLLWNLKLNGKKKLWPNTDIIVEFIRKWKEEAIAYFGHNCGIKRKWKEEVMAL